MKYFIASDIHGSALWCRKMLERFQASGAERMVLLGDILYHGPRNDLPEEYAPKQVIAMLNPLKNRIYAVRGNCEAEVDQMVLEFPVMADYALLSVEGHTIYATHGHIWNEEHLPPLQQGDVLLHGHTHLLCAESLEREGIHFFHLNPGSVAIPKGGNPHSYGLLEEGCFRIFDFQGEVLREIELWK